MRPRPHRRRPRRGPGAPGVAGALLTPGSLAVIQSGLRPEDRGRAIGTWAGIGAVAPALGPPLGGWLAELDWRLVFLVDLPIAALALALTARFVPESRDTTASGRLDLAGAVLGVLALAGLTVALVGAGGGEGGGASGVDNAVSRAGGLVAVAALPAFVGLGAQEYADPVALTAGYRTALLVCAGLLVAGGLSALALPRRLVDCAPRR